MLDDLRHYRAEPDAFQLLDEPLAFVALLALVGLAFLVLHLA